MEKLPVIFRRGTREVIAFFPTLPANTGRMVCYMHVGQHSEASFEHYYATKPTTPDDYADLLAELKQIYDDCELVVRRRRPAWNA